MDVLDYIDLAVHDGKPVAQEVIKYINAHKDMLTSLDVTVRISICRSNKGIRATAEESVDRLQQMIKTNPDLPKVWKNGIYIFNFDRMDFKQGKFPIHLTAGEAVVLYQKLIRKQSPNGWGAYYANMRKRHGDGFLSGAV